jgi:hypothetical protein
LIGAIGTLRRRLDRCDWLAPGWSGSGGFITGVLKTSLVYEFENVSSAARRLGSRSVVHLADDLDAVRVPVLAVIDPPSPGGLGAADRDRLRRVLDGLTRAATKAAQRSRWLQGSVVVALLIAAAIGFVLGFLLGWVAR